MGEDTNYNVKNEVLEIAIMTAVLILWSSVGLVLTGFIGGGFTEIEFTRFWGFYAPFIAFYFGIIALKVGEIITKGKWFKQPIHDTLRSPAVGGKSRIINNPFKLGMVSLIIAGWLSFWGTTQETIFAPTRIAGQQATKLAAIFGGIEPAVTMETLFMMFVIGAMWSIAMIIINKLKLDRKIWIPIFGFLIILGVMFTGVGIHKLRYSETEGALISTAFFWGISGASNVLTGSAIPMFVYHVTNNFFAALKAEFARGVFLAYSFGTMIFITAIGSLILFWKPKGKPKVYR